MNRDMRNRVPVTPVTRPAGNQTGHTRIAVYVKKHMLDSGMTKVVLECSGSLQQSLFEQLTTTCSAYEVQDQAYFTHAACAS